jgi:hypothetical protein
MDAATAAPNLMGVEVQRLSVTDCSDAQFTGITSTDSFDSWPALPIDSHLSISRIVRSCGNVVITNDARRCMGSF